MHTVNIEAASLQTDSSLLLTQVMLLTRHRIETRKLSPIFQQVGEINVDAYDKSLLNDDEITEQKQN